MSPKQKRYLKNKKNHKPDMTIKFDLFEQQIDIWFDIKDMVEFNVKEHDIPRDRFKEYTESEYMRDGLSMNITHPCGIALHMIYLYDWDDIPIMAHELVHSIDFIHDVAGIPINLECNETRAYMIGYSLEQYMKQLKELKRTIIR